MEPAALGGIGCFILVLIAGFFALLAFEPFVAVVLLIVVLGAAVAAVANK